MSPVIAAAAGFQCWITPCVVDEEDAVVDVLEHARVPLEREPLAFDLAVEPAHLDRALERGDEVVAVDRLRDEVVRAAAERPDGEVVLAVAGDQERRRSGPHLPDLLEQGEAVHPGHLDVGHDRVVVDLLDPLERVRRASPRCRSGSPRMRSRIACGSASSSATSSSTSRIRASVILLTSLFYAPFR